MKGGYGWLADWLRMLGDIEKRRARLQTQGPEFVTPGGDRPPV